ncbi:hypothetical protein tb265_46580 [Gemmatimonadetes bacterium T265]|nr:hypothetical protein tb265_46580 [Gemmatimonadetes bacterium T265]
MLSGGIAPRPAERGSVASNDASDAASDAAAHPDRPGPRFARAAVSPVADSQRRIPMETTQDKNTICLWYDHDAEEAARLYARTFPDSTVGAVHRAPSDFPGGRAGDVLTVAFTVCGVPCLGLNGGDRFTQSEAFSFQIATDDQAETDRSWDAIVGTGGAESACGWCKDQVGPVVADHAARADRGDGPGRRRGAARVRGDDADAEDRRRPDRGGGARRGRAGVRARHVEHRFSCSADPPASGTPSHAPEPAREALREARGG